MIGFGLNSTMVRLKHKKETWNFSAAVLSQFHYGSIKTKLCTIISRKLKRLNSTMVRLKLSLCTTISRKLKLSQFHYGSIKTEIVKNIISMAFLSQFHYGSIKTYEWFSNKNSFTGSLNSTMVRLKLTKEV